MISYKHIAILVFVFITKSICAQTSNDLLDDIKISKYASDTTILLLQDSLALLEKQLTADTLGELYYFAQRRFDESVPLEIKRQFNKKTIHYYNKSDSLNYRKINCYSNIAESFESENIDSALYYFDIALSLPTQNHYSQMSHAAGLFDKSNLYVTINDYNSKYKIIQSIRSLPFYDTLDPYQKVNTIFQLGQSEEKIPNKIKFAEGRFLHCLRELENKTILTPDENHIYASSIYGLGNVYHKYQQYDKSNSYYKRYLALIEDKKEDDKFKNDWLHCHISLSQSYISTENIDSANYFIDQAINAAFFKRASPISIANCLRQKAELHYNLKRYQEALILLDEASALYKSNKNLSSQVYFQLEDVIQIYFNKAKIFIQLFSAYFNSKYKEQAIRNFEIADSLTVQVLLSQFNFESSGLLWIDQMHENLASAVDAAFIFKDPKLAWKYTEKRKSFLLLQLLLENQSPETIKIYKKINSLTVREKHLLQSSDTDLNFETNDSLLQKIQYEKQTLLEDPILRKSRISNLVQNFYPDKKDKRHYLQYISGTQNLYLISYYDKKYEIYNLGLKNEIYNDLDILYKQLSKNISINEQNYNQLNEKLFPKNILEVSNKITIIPDIEMPGVPFEIFSSEHIFTYQLSYAIQNEVEQLHYNKKEIVIDHPEYKWQEDSNFIKPLKYAEEESNYLTSLFPESKIQQDSETSRNELWSSASIIHFTGHGYMNSDYDNSFLALASDTCKIDSKLTFKDIQLLDIKADMVVLSACETAIGNVSRGEGVMSISRSLIQAGTKSVISTLWSVNEQSTSEILKHFYNYLLEGKRKDEALHLAKQTYLSNAPVSMRHPQYWSGIIAIGDMSPIIKEDNWLKYFGIFGVLFLLFILAFRIKYTKAS